MSTGTRRAADLFLAAEDIAGGGVRHRVIRGYVSDPQGWAPNTGVWITDMQGQSRWFPSHRIIEIVLQPAGVAWSDDSVRN